VQTTRNYERPKLTIEPPPERPSLTLPKPTSVESCRPWAIRPAQKRSQAVICRVEPLEIIRRGYMEEDGRYGW
jgi:hypothetical protein